MTPPPTNDDGRPSAPTSSSIRCCSTSVAAGEVDHNMPCTPRPDDSRSPSTDGSEAFDGK
jgi:hypothetical protein